ncbi:Imm7 family immunity protein [Ancylobacter sp. FA202]|uniref:Imm7 family immunity protein n=1 Tax=Ancylobacter sp. FA202 TaxID=1111106 RepID=UPI0003827080|nr:Imm7 family immunity protein [Ancylobacter sp. FA202]
MFSYHMWLVSAPGQKLGHEPCSDEEYAPIERGGALVERLQQSVEDSIFKHLTHNEIRVLEPGPVDMSVRKIRDGLAFIGTSDGFITSLNFERNHVPENILRRQLHLLEDIGRIAPATYGVAYLYSDDEPPFAGHFEVMRMIKGRIERSRDAFFDQHFPVNHD